MAKLGELARVVRSKNVGPYMFALDIVFDRKDIYEKVVASGVITKERIAALYRIKTDRITDLVFFAPGNAIKVSIIRPIPSGNFTDADVLGSQQYAPLDDIEVPEPLAAFVPSSPPPPVAKPGESAGRPAGETTAPSAPPGDRS